MVKFIYSEKAKIFCEISTLLLSVCNVDKSKVEISQNFVAFSEYLNFMYKVTKYLTEMERTLVYNEQMSDFAHFLRM